MLILVTAFVPGVAGEASERQGLADRLRVSEKLPGTMHGRIEYRKRLLTPGYLDHPEGYVTSDLQYEFAFTSESACVKRVSHNDFDDSSVTVYGANPRYRFRITRQDQRWLVQSIRPASRIDHAKDQWFGPFLRHFEALYAFQGEQIRRRLLEDRDGVELTKVSESEYELQWRKKTNEGNHEHCVVIIAAPPNCKYAYVLKAWGVLRDPHQVLRVTVENEVREEAERPILVESKRIIRSRKETPTIEVHEVVRRFDVIFDQEADSNSLFTLSHYGLPEPDPQMLQGTSGDNRFLWFLVLLFVGVGLLVFGRQIWRRRFRPAGPAADSSNVPAS